MNLEIKLILAVIALIILILSILYAYTYFRLAKKIYTHIPLDKQRPENFGLTAQRVSFPSFDGKKISAWYIKADHPKAIVILIHGYGSPLGGKAQMLDHAKYLYSAGYSSLLIDLRSFGESEGRKITLGIDESKDIASAYNFLLTTEKTDDVKIGFLGISMGGVAAIIAAGIHGIGDFVVAAGAYNNIDTIFKAQIKNEGRPVFLFMPLLKLAAKFQLGFDYNNISAERFISQIRASILIIHGRNDQLISPAKATLLYQKANEPKFFWLAETEHDVFQQDRDGFRQTVLNFLAKL